MSEALRLETQMLERVKSDFLGSISHEMKTPLHQTLGNLELLLQTSCTDEQYDFAVNARFGATQLLETIDKILLYSSISSESEAKVKDVSSELDTILHEKDAPQIIRPRLEHVGGNHEANTPAGDHHVTLGLGGIETGRGSRVVYRTFQPARGQA
jgi:signal transduction histidine kinase